MFGSLGRLQTGLIATHWPRRYLDRSCWSLFVLAVCTEDMVETLSGALSLKGEDADLVCLKGT